MLAVRGLGQLIGERASLEASVRSATVIALEMVWALVVHTRDFAAFLSAHPRVRSMVENQRHHRGGNHRAGTDTNVTTDPSGLRYWGAAGRHGRQRRNCQVVGGGARDDCMARTARSSLTDVVGFGARTRTDGDRQSIREALFRMTTDGRARIS